MTMKKKGAIKDRSESKTKKSETSAEELAALNRERKANRQKNGDRRLRALILRAQEYSGDRPGMEIASAEKTCGDRGGASRAGRSWK